MSRASSARRPSLFRRRVRLRAAFGVIVTVMFVNPLFPAPAHAETPLGMLSPGTYLLDDYSLGSVQTGSLVVSDNGEYRQSFNTGSGLFEVWPVLSSDPLSPFNVVLTELNFGGIYYYPTATSPEPLYRPFEAPGVLMAPGSSGGWTMASEQAGGVKITAYWTVAEPHFLLVNGLRVFVQRMDTYMGFWNNSSGFIQHTHWSVPGDPSNFRDDYAGEVFMLGEHVVVGTSISHGNLLG